MPRIDIKYECGCEISPFVAFEEGEGYEPHGYDVEMTFCEKHSEAAKISKIMNWSSCKNLTKIRVFIRICIYYQIWIENFAIIT